MAKRQTKSGTVSKTTAKKTTTTSRKPALAKQTLSRKTNAKPATAAAKLKSTSVTGAAKSAAKSVKALTGTPTAKKPAAKKTATSTKSRTTAKKPVAKKPTTRKTAPAAKTVKKPVAKKAASPQKAKTAAKPVAKKASTAKPAPKKTIARKPAKPAPKKTVLKKPAPKKPAAKKILSKPVRKETVETLRVDLAKIVARLKAADTTTRKNVKILETAFSSLEKQVKNHQTVNHAALTRRVDQLSSQLTKTVDTARRDITADLKTSLQNPTVPGLEAAIARSESRLAETEMAQTAALSKVNRHIADLARVIDARLKSQAGKTENQNEKIRGIETQLTGIQSQSYERIRLVEDTTADAVRKLGDDIVSATERLHSKIERQNETMKERMTQIASKTQAEFDNQKTDLSRRMESIEDSQKNQTNYIDRAISKLASRIDSLEYGLSQVPEAPAAPAAIIPAAPDALPPMPAETTAIDNDYEAEDAFAAADSLLDQPVAANAPEPETPAYDDPYSADPIPAAQPTYIPPAVVAPVAAVAAAAPQQVQSYDGSAPQEYNPAPPVQTMAPQHHYVDPAQAAYTPPPPQAYADPYADQTSAAVQTHPSYDYQPSEDGPTEYTPSTGVDELPYDNPGYGEGQNPEGVSRPGHVEDLRAKKKKLKAKSGSALSSLPLTPRNLKVAGLAVLLAGVGYFGLRGLMGSDPAQPQVVTAEINQPIIPNAAITTPGVEMTAPIGDYQDNRLTVTETVATPDGTTLQAAAEAGNPIAQYQLGVSYLDAGRPKDGIKYIRESANQGQPAAQYRLAKLYEAGIGVAADPDMARQLTERAARSGNRIAMHDLGLYYAEGRGGVERNMQTALNWFEKAAERGVVDSQYNLGVLFESSPEIARDAVSAMVWYSIAGSQGDQLAANRVGVLNSELSAEDLSRAEARIKQFKPTAIDEAANGIFRSVPWTMPENKPLKASAELVRDAQTLLAQLGYEVGTPDGDFGPRTRQAVIAFEKANDLPETGTVTASLLDRLEAAAGV